MTATKRALTGAANPLSGNGHYVQVHKNYTTNALEQFVVGVTLMLIIAAYTDNPQVLRLLATSLLLCVHMYSQQDTVLDWVHYLSLLSYPWNEYRFHVHILHVCVNSFMIRIIVKLNAHAQCKYDIRQKSQLIITYS